MQTVCRKSCRKKQKPSGAFIGFFVEGNSTNAIAAALTAEGISTPGGKSIWQRATVESILTNEKYKGSALLQKKFTVDFLSKKMKENEGEVPQYYVEDSHPAIIPPEEWEAVQLEMEERRKSNKRHRHTSPFSGKLICSDCGETFGAKVWHSTDKYRTIDTKGFKFACKMAKKSTAGEGG